MHPPFQLFYLVFTEATSETVSVDGWLSGSQSYSGLKIRGSRSYGVINRPQSLNRNIMEAVRHHLDRERNKRQPTYKEEL